jgi:hypothetical protein
MKGLHWYYSPPKGGTTVATMGPGDLLITKFYHCRGDVMAWRMSEIHVHQTKLTSLKWNQHSCKLTKNLQDFHSWTFPGLSSTGSIILFHWYIHYHNPVGWVPLLPHRVTLVQHRVTLFPHWSMLFPHWATLFPHWVFSWNYTGQHGSTLGNTGSTLGNTVLRT